MDKSTLRQRMLQQREQFSAEQRERWDREILRQLQKCERVRRAHTLMVYMSFRGEAGTDSILQWGLAEGKRLVAPVTRVRERELIPVEVRSLRKLTIGAFGIREPLFHEERRVPLSDIDLILIPGVAFDVKGGRLGYGGGFYDRFLSRLEPHTWKIGLAYHWQIIEHVPMEPHDVLLDAIVCDSGWIFTPSV